MFVLGYSPHPSDEAQHTPRKMARIHAFKKKDTQFKGERDCVLDEASVCAVGVAPKYISQGLLPFRVERMPLAWAPAAINIYLLARVLHWMKFLLKAAHLCRLANVGHDAAYHRT